MLKPIDRIAKAAQSIRVPDLNSRIEVTSSNKQFAFLKQPDIFIRAKVLE